MSNGNSSEFLLITCTYKSKGIEKLPDGFTGKEKNVTYVITSVQITGSNLSVPLADSIMFDYRYYINEGLTIVPSGNKGSMFAIVFTDEAIQIKNSATATGNRFECVSGSAEYESLSTILNFDTLNVQIDECDNGNGSQLFKAQESYALYTNEAYTLPEDPVKEGYDFVGWYYDEALTQPYDGAPITADTQLYAKFEKKQFTVTFDTAGGAMSGGASETYTVPWDEYFTVMAYQAERTGHRFLGWQLPDGSMAGDSVLVRDNVTLTAKWQIESYTIRFETNGGEPMADKQLEYGTELTLETPVKEGSTFTGWYSDEGLTNLFGGAGGTLTVDGDKTLYAGWEIKSFTVKFEALGGTAVSSQVVYYGSAADEEPTATERTGYNFTGWYLNGTLYNFATPVMSDITLTAGWEIKMFTVTFYVDGEVYATSEVAYGTKLSSVMTETANLMNLQVTALSVPSDEDFKDVEVKQDLEVTAVPMTGVDKVVNTAKNNKWVIIGGVGGVIVFIGVIIAAVCIKRGKI